MPICPTCKKRSKGEFCPHCGIHFGPSDGIAANVQKPAQGFPTMYVAVAIIVLLGGILVFLFLVGGLGALFLFVESQTDVPTSVGLNAPNAWQVDMPLELKVTLTDSRNNIPLQNKTVTVDYQDGKFSAITDKNGVARFNIMFNSPAVWTVLVSFKGDSTYLASEKSIAITANVPSCGDGTPVYSCSSLKAGYYCFQNLSLSFDCAACGCANGLVCYENYCVTEELRGGLLIEDLQESMVYVEHTYATGSGVIIAQDGEYTWVMTNKHVIADADRVSDVHVTLQNQQTIPASNILIAPFDMDVALIALLGTYGVPVKVNVTDAVYKGQEVIALGSPLGIQGSVSKGIVSNLLYEFTPSDYRYVAIQTDAAINPGNSGGGLFLKSTGNLVGINTFVISSEYGAEGLGFAIDVRSIDELPLPSTWEGFVPVSKCYDGTPYDSCSLTNVGQYCSNGRLTNSCQVCGCASGSYCGGDNACFSCQPGYSAWETSGNELFCCPTGWQGYTEGENGYCCPPGTRGYAGGSCE